MNDSIAPQALVPLLDPRVIKVNECDRRAECSIVHEWPTNLGQGEGRGACKEGMNVTSVHHKTTSSGEHLNLIE